MSRSNDLQLLRETIKRDYCKYTGSPLRLPKINRIRHNKDTSAINDILNHVYHYIDLLVIHLNNRNADFMVTSRISQIKVENIPNRLCGTRSRGLIICETLPYLKNTTRDNNDRVINKDINALIPMMYHVVQGYGLLYTELNLTLSYVSRIENFSVSNWEEEINSLLYQHFSEYLLNGQSAESQLLSDNIVKVINKIIYLRSVNNTHCIGKTNKKHNHFTLALINIRKTAMLRRVCGQ